MNQKNIITATNIQKRYGKGESSTFALKGVSLEVARGDFLMITGRNGSGKSTLLHQLALLDRPSRGDIFFNGEDVLKMSNQKRSDFRLNNIGYIFQEYALIGELTAIENVMLPSMMVRGIRESKRRAREKLDIVGLSDKVKRRPSELSGGEQQRVAIARALINDPDIIFADEPTANIDTVRAKQILDIFKKINEDGKTIVMITHESDELLYASRHITLSDGKVVKNAAY